MPTPPLQPFVEPATDPAPVTMPCAGTVDLHAGPMVGPASGPSAPGPVTPPAGPGPLPAPSGLPAFLAAVTADLDRGLLRGPTPRPATGKVQRQKKPVDPDNVRRSSRLAGKPAGMGNALTLAQRNICRKLGEEFEDPAEQPAVLLSRYQGLFPAGQLDSAQIKALTDLALNATAGRRAMAQA